MIPQKSNAPLQSERHFSNVSRRTLVKGAAWSVPVVAAAVHVPALAASANWDVQISMECSGDYELSALEAIVPDLLLGQVRNLLAGLGYHPNPQRSFTILAAEGTVPEGTQFLIRDTDGILDLSFLQGLVGIQGWFLVTVNPEGYLFTLQQDLSQGQLIQVDLTQAFLDVSILASTEMRLFNPADDNPSGDPMEEGPDAATISVLAGVTVEVPLVGGQLGIQACGSP